MMTVSYRVMVPFFMGVFFSLLLASRYGLLQGLGFLAALTVICILLNIVIYKLQDQKEAVADNL